MLTNDQMKAGRYARWAAARKKVAWINDQLSRGRTVQLTTYTRATRYTAKSAIAFKATRTGAYVQRGRHWDCIDGCDLRAFG
jgi:hypothetical protein